MIALRLSFFTLVFFGGVSLFRWKTLGGKIETVTTRGRWGARFSRDLPRCRKEEKFVIARRRSSFFFGMLMRDAERYCGGAFPLRARWKLNGAEKGVILNCLTFGKIMGGGLFLPLEMEGVLMLL